MNPAEYQPSPSALEPLRDAVLVPVVGPSGAGKTTLINQAVEQHSILHVVMSDTSREPRPGERHGVDYNFRTREDMLARIARGEYAQVPPIISGDLYANSPESFAVGGIGIMAVWADAMPRFRALPFRELRPIFVVPPSYQIWRDRLPNDRNALDKRLAEARRSLQFGIEADDVTYVVNDMLRTSVEHLAIAALGKPRTPRMEVEQRRARGILRDILRDLANDLG